MNEPEAFYAPFVRRLRYASRECVRELGFMRQELFQSHITHNQFHAMQLLTEWQSLSINELAEHLRLDKSSSSRLADKLIGEGFAKSASDTGDQRRKVLSLTAKGRRKFTELDQAAERQVVDAISSLPPEEIELITRGFEAYNRALKQARRLAQFRIEPITAADDEALAAVILAGLAEHDAVRPGFACYDPEFYELSKYFTEPRRSYFVVKTEDGKVVGGGGVGQLKGEQGDICELQKMYLLPEARGTGVATRLMKLCLEAARQHRFETVYLETLDSMRAAQKLYTRFGFRRLEAPLGGTGHFGCNTWMALELGR